MAEEQDKIKEMNDWYETARSEDSEWYTEAESCKKYYWSEHWDPKDIAELNKQKRPHLTYNEIWPTVNLVSGMQRQNRMGLKAYNRVGGSGESAEIITTLIKDVENQSDGEFEHSDAFLDGLLTGRGFLGIDINYDTDIVNGDITIGRKNPLVIKIDPGFEKYDLSDAMYIFEEGWYLQKQLQLNYPESAEQLKMIGGMVSTDLQLIKGMNPKDDYGSTEAVGSVLKEPEKYRLKVKTCWYKVYERVKFLYNEKTDDIEEVDKESEATLDEFIAVQKSFGVNLQVISNVQPVLHLAIYVGNILLADHRKPYGEVNRYPIIPYFAYKQDDRNTGMISPLKDPQDGVNKRKSQFLHIINTLANSGWLIKKGSVEDVNNFKKFGSKPGFVGEYTGEKPERITPPGVPQGHLIAAQEDSEAIKKISGVNIDLLGQGGGRDEPGITLQLRQRQGQLVIEQLHDNWRRTRKLTGEAIVDFIQKARTYTSEEIMNIMGREVEGGGIINKLKNWKMRRDIDRVMNDVNVGRYEIKVDVAPSSPTVKQANFSALVEAAKAGLPIPPDILLEAHPDLPNRDEIVKRVKALTQSAEAEGPGGPSETPGSAIPGGETPIPEA